MYKVEKDWEHNGYRCVVIAWEMGHRCGYVGVSDTHPLYNKKYDSAVPDSILPKYKDVMNGTRGKRSVLGVLCASAAESRVGILFDVHGGITYSEGGKKSRYPVESDLWWFGFDCGHYGDGIDISIMSDKYKEINIKYSLFDEGVIRTTEYCIQECESLADQLKALE
jgi:hypothetical protein